MIAIRYRRAPGLALLVAVLSSACATNLGPKTIPSARFDYNERVARSVNEQLLLNLVRLRYRDTPLFIDVSSIIAQYSLTANANLSGAVRLAEGAGEDVGGGLGGAYAERPAITYEPLKGEEFARRLLAPIAPETLALLSSSGWSIERLMMCCVQELNGVENAPSATGPAPQALPDNERFRDLARRLRTLQHARKLRIYLDRPRNDGGKEQPPEVVIRLEAQGDDSDEAALLEQVRSALNLGSNRSEFRLVAHRAQREPDEVAVGARSLLGVLFFLSLAVDPPAAHRDAGLVGAADLDWQRVINRLLRVRSAASPPPSAFVRIRYRNHWFYIEDQDLESKATFNLLTYLYSLQAGEGGASPLLTVPIR